MRCFGTSNTEYSGIFPFYQYFRTGDTLDPFSEMKDNDKHDIYQKGNADENVHMNANNIGNEHQQRQQTAHSTTKKSG